MEQTGAIKHLQWLRNLKLSALNREILNEYMATFGELTAKVERFDARIEELAAQERYQEKVKRPWDAFWEYRPILLSASL